MLMMMATAGVSQAALNDTRETIAREYGEYRIVIDRDDQRWTKAEWESKGWRYAKAASYWHMFWRRGNAVQMTVAYDADKPGSFVRAQRYTLENPIKIKDFRTYFPELGPLITSSQTLTFASEKKLGRHLTEAKSPVTMGVLVKETPSPGKHGWYTLLSFAVYYEGRYVTKPAMIDGDISIKEFTIERVARSDAEAKAEKGEWQEIPNYFQ